MNLHKAKELKKEYNLEYDRLFKIGESKYGISSKYNEMPGWFASEEIAKHVKYDEWHKAIVQLNYKWNSGYTRFSKRNYKEVNPNLSIDALLFLEIGNQMAYNIDRSAIKAFKKFIKGNK